MYEYWQVSFRCLASVPSAGSDPEVPYAVYQDKIRLKIAQQLPRQHLNLPKLWIFKTGSYFQSYKRQGTRLEVRLEDSS
jgi:hypothetical protein